MTASARARAARWRAHGRGFRTGAPAAVAQDHDVQIESGGGKRNEIDQRRKGNDAGGEIAELFGDGKLFGEALGRAGNDGPGVIEEDGDGTEHRAQDEGDGQVIGQRGGQHADGKQRRAHQPIAQISGEHQAGVGTAQPAQHHHMTE